MRTHIYPTKAELAEAAVKYFVDAAESSISRRGRFAVALSGGSTPRDVYARLAEPQTAARIPWERVHLFWGDERMVSPDHPDSNFRMVKESLLQFITIPQGNVHRIKAELPPEMAAEQYQQELQDFFREELPQFDLMLLGLGEDGHTASLFPGTTAPDEKEKLATAVYVPKFAAWRVTLTLPVLNNAREVIFLVAGEKKAEIVQRIAALREPSPEYPASLVQPRSGNPLWMLDAEAGGNIKD